MIFSPDDARHMARALQVAQRGLYTTDPNPRVGCVIVKDGAVIGEGWHERAGKPHAEILALRVAGGAARGATVYLTFEPCCHHGRTPPCTRALIEAGVARVVSAMLDPNPRVAGKGFAELEAAGIAVQQGLMEAEAAILNPGFIARMRDGRPFVRVKLAASLDGRTALVNGESKWITSPAARMDVQRWRARSSVILTGIETVLADDPSLTVRELGIARTPLRVVLDSRLRCPPHAKVLQRPAATVVITTGADGPAAMALRAAGAEVVALAEQEGRVPLAEMLRHLAARDVNEILVEAGPTLSGALLRAGLVDELVLYYAAHVMGAAARGMLEIGVLTSMEERVPLVLSDVRRMGPDLRIIARPVK